MSESKSINKLCVYYTYITFWMLASLTSFSFERFVWGIHISLASPTWLLIANKRKEEVKRRLRNVNVILCSMADELRGIFPPSFIKEQNWPEDNRILCNNYYPSSNLFLSQIYNNSSRQFSTVLFSWWQDFITFRNLFKIN